MFLVNVFYVFWVILLIVFVLLNFMVMCDVKVGYWIVESIL